MELDEKFLIKELNNKNKVVFDLVFTYYYSGLCAYVFHITGNREASEDLVQDFFVWLWFQTGNLTITTSLKSYIFSSAKNRALDYLKHEKVKHVYSRKAKSQKEAVLPDDMWEFTESELRELIEKGLEHLPPRTREIFLMSRFKGIPNDKIAEELNISKRTVEVQISMALKIMRSELKPYLPLLALYLL